MADTRINIPWNDNSGNNLHLDLDPELNPEEVVIEVSSDANNTGLERRKDLVFKGTVPIMGQQSIATMNVAQPIVN